MPKGVWMPVTKADLRDRIKEIEERIKAMDRREKYFLDLKKWLATRKLTYTELYWMARQMKPKRADKPVKSKKPLQPPAPRLKAKRKGDPEFQRALREARVKQEMTTAQLGEKVGVSGTSISGWERGRYVPTEASRMKLLKALNLPAHLGAEAWPPPTNGRGA